MTILHHGIELIDNDALVLMEIEKLTNRTLFPQRTIEYSVVGFQAKKGRVIAIGLYGCKICIIPKTFFTLTALQKVNLWDNSLTFLPDEFNVFSSLSYLNLESNLLTKLPNSLFSLPLLRLYLGNNQLKTLPKAIHQLKDTLIYLNLSNNQITDLPSEIYELSGLQTLGLGNNLLKKVPHELVKLGALEKLTFEGMGIKKVPPILNNLPKLKEIYL